MMILAVDPGMSGGLAWGRNEPGSVTLQPMPETEGDITEVIREQTKLAVQMFPTHQLVAVLEEQFFFGPYANPVSSGKFGANFGYLKGSLAYAGWRIELVRPTRWQSELGLGNSKGLTKTQWKNKLKTMGQRLYPNLIKSITLSTADALLIYEWKLRNLA